MKTRIIVPRLASLLFLLVIAATIASAQKMPVPNQIDSRPFVLGITDEIQSNVLAEKRILNIYLPEGYNADSAATYPVIYLLDGSADEDFIHVVGVEQFLVMIQAMPKTIIVGVGNVDRRRDFTFPTTIDSDKKAYPTTGGSEKFIRFVKNELQPYIEHKYRTGTRTLIGESLGGLVATEILLREPQLFDKYIIVSPSLWWDQESLLHKAPQLAKSIGDKGITAYIAVGSEGKVMETDAKEMADILKKQNDPHLKVYFETMPKENHLTILHLCVYQALETLNGKK